MSALIELSVKQLERYPIYLKYLLTRQAEGITHISAPVIAAALGYTEEQVRKDLQPVTRSSGKPKSGREIGTLILDLETFLGYHDAAGAVVVGVGHLGGAFMAYPGFEEFGLRILAGFDLDPAKVGHPINGKEVFPIEKIPNLIPRLQVHIAILAVPASAANTVAAILVKAGIRALWNFAPVHLDVPAGVVVEDVNLASSLAVLSHKLKVMLQAEHKGK